MRASRDREPGVVGRAEGLEPRRDRAARGPAAVRGRHGGVEREPRRRAGWIRRPVRARARPGAHRGARSGRRGVRRGPHDRVRDRSHRVPRVTAGLGRGLSPALRPALSGHGPARGERPRGPRRQAGDRGHGRARGKEAAVSVNVKSFRYEYDVETGVATITLDRPERLNALTFEAYAELRDTFAALDTEPGVRCVLLTGSGRGFCSGGDVEDIIGKLFGRSAEQLLEFTQMTCDVVANMRRCRRPIVAAVNGTAAGAGAVLAAASDIRFAADSARIAFLFVKVGLSGADMGISWLLPRLVGQGNASELLFTGDFISAQRAHEMGLYQRVLPAERLLPEARAFAEQLARGPADALAVSKRALALESHMTLEEALDHEARVQAELMTHPDYREAYEAFRAKRSPTFR